MSNQIPLILVVGFLEAGKSTYLNQYLKTFEDKKVLLLQCEEGEIELDRFSNVIKEEVEYLEDFNRADLVDISSKVNPDVIVAEINGMWPLQNVEMGVPSSWKIEEIHLIINAETFENYSKMMGSLMNEKIRFANKIIFNRVTDELAVMLRKKNIRLLNNSNQIYLQYEDKRENYDNGLLRPEAFTKDFVQISDEDFGYWFADYSNDQKFYCGKRIQFQSIVVKNEKLAENEFVCGRSAMVCCGNDMVFIGLLCVKENNLQPNQWVSVTGTIKENESYAKALNVPYYVDVEKIELLDMIEDPIVRF